MKKIFNIGLLLAIATAFIGCDDDIEQAAVAFTGNVEQTLLEGSSNAVAFNLVFSRPLEVEGSVTIGYESETGVLGSNFEVNFSSFAPGEFRIPVSAGTESISFRVNSIEDGQFTNGHNIRFYLKSVAGGVRSTTDTEASLIISDSAFPDLLTTIDFENCPERFAIPDPFTEYRVEGFKQDRGWGCSSFGFEGQGVQGSGFGGESGTVNTYLILNLDDVSGLSTSAANSFYIGFLVESFFDGAGTIELKYSTNYSGSGNPENATWTDLDIAEQLPPTGSGQANAPDGFWKEVFVDASGIAGQSDVYIAFRYFGATSSSSSSWSIDNLSFYGN